MNRICGRCNYTFPLTKEFFAWRKDKRIFNHNCRSCDAERAKTWYKNNKERAKASQKVWKSKNAEKQRKYDREYKSYKVGMNEIKNRGNDI